MRRSVALLILFTSSVGVANLLFPGIVRQQVQLLNGQSQYVGFPQSALNNTEVQIGLKCADQSTAVIDVQFVIRSSPCDREFFDARRLDKLKSRMTSYFSKMTEIPPGYDYGQIVFFRSKVVSIECASLHDAPTFLINEEHSSMTSQNVTSSADFDLPDNQRSKRANYPGTNKDTIDGGTKLSLTSWHPVQTLPVDAIYFLVVQLSLRSGPETNVTIEVEWRGPFGFLSAIDYPLLHFYLLMCIFYTILALVWLFFCLKYYTDLLRIQFWIGAVLILGMVEKAVFYSEYATMNNSGESVEGIIELAEVVSSLKRTMARVLIIIVSVGYGVVKPRLGSTLNQVAGVGIVYFVFSTIEGLARVSNNHVEAMKQRQFATLPLVILDLSIFWWIFNSLIATMRALRLRRNEVKLCVYRHFTNTLCFAVLASGIFMVWSLIYHIFPNCLKDWKELWVDTAFWHVLFCSILVVIMFLWRPSVNNQRYAFTPLLDDSEDENEDEDVLYNQNTPGFDVLTKRGADEPKEPKKDKRLQEDLKWIEDHIPRSITDHLIADEDEDREARELEISKML